MVLRVIVTPSLPVVASAVVTCSVNNSAEVLLAPGWQPQSSSSLSSTLTMDMDLQGSTQSAWVNLTAVGVEDNTNGDVAAPVLVSCAVTSVSALRPVQWHAFDGQLVVWNRNTVVPFISDLQARLGGASSSSYVSGLADGAMTLTVSPGTLLCVTAAPAPDGVPAFVPPVGLTLSVQGQPPVICDPEANTSNATRVCGIVPSLHELCGDGNATQVEACVTYGTYASLTVWNGGRSSPVARRLDAQVQLGPVNGSVTCPHQCPAPSRGVYVTNLCGSQLPDPALCLSPGTAARCWRGTPPSCTMCPPGALCPGGHRVWPQQGWWAASEAATGVRRCGFPATERCIGVSVTSGLPVCGPGYLHGRVMCAQCAAGFFQGVDGSCRACPAGPHLYTGVIVAIAAPLALFVFALSVAAASAKLGAPSTPFTPSDIHLLLGRSSGFVLWCIILLQPVAQIGQQALGAGRGILHVYTYLQMVLADPVGVLDPACASNPPGDLTVDVVKCAVGIATALAAMGLVWHARRAGASSRPAVSNVTVVLTNPLAAEAKGLEDKEQVPPASSGAALGTRRPLTARKHPANTHKPPVAPTPASTPAWPGLVRLGVAAVLLVYPVVATAALRLVHCESLPQAGDGLHGSVLASKPWIRCGGAEHMTAAGVAAVALVVMVAGVPLVLIVHLLRSRCTPSIGLLTASSVGPLQSRPAALLPLAWTLQCLLLSCSTALLSDGTSKEQAIRLALDVVAVTATLACAAAWRPLPEAQRWRLVGLVATWIVSCAAACGNLFFILAAQSTSSTLSASSLARPGMLPYRAAGGPAADAPGVEATSWTLVALVALVPVSTAVAFVVNEVRTLRLRRGGLRPSPVGAQFPVGSVLVGGSTKDAVFANPMHTGRRGVVDHSNVLLMPGQSTGGRHGPGGGPPAGPPPPTSGSLHGTTSGTASRKVIHPAGGRYGGGDDDDAGHGMVELSSVRRLEFTRVGTAPDRVRGAAAGGGAAGGVHRRPLAQADLVDSSRGGAAPSTAGPSRPKLPSEPSQPRR